MSPEELFDKYQWHATRYTKRFAYAVDLQDEFIWRVIQNAALFGVYKAATHFDPERGAPFVPYAYLCMKRSVRKELKKERVLEFDREHESIEDRENNDLETGIERDEGGPSLDFSEVSNILFASLTPKQRMVFQHYFVDEKTGTEVAKIIKATRQAVSRLVMRIQRKAHDMTQSHQIEGRAAKRRRHTRDRRTCPQTSGLKNINITPGATPITWRRQYN